MIIKCYLFLFQRRFSILKIEDIKIISQVILSAERSSGKFSDRVLLLGEGDQVRDCCGKIIKKGD